MQRQWGAKGPKPAKKLYKLVFDRLTRVHGLKNLVWVWNSVAADWYPGNSYVDVVSADTYAQGDHGVSPPYSQPPHAFWSACKAFVLTNNSPSRRHTTTSSPSRAIPRSSLLLRSGASWTRRSSRLTRLTGHGLLSGRASISLEGCGIRWSC